MTAPKPICAHCGASYGQRATRNETATRGPDGTWPPYVGNGIVIKEFTTSPSAKLAYRTIWDGETWWKPYDPFCKLRCALDYARKAWKKHGAVK